MAGIGRGACAAPQATEQGPARSSGKSLTYTGPGEDAIINGSDDTIHLNGSWEDVKVNGSHDSIVVETMQDVYVNGSHNALRAGRLGDVYVMGSHNEVTWIKGDPDVKNTGRHNGIHRLRR